MYGLCSKAFFLLISVAYVAGFLGVTQSRYGDCFVFEPGTVDFDATNCIVCLVQNDLEFCRSFECLPTNCTNPTDQHCCPSCPGTCNYGGNIYNVGESFRCLGSLGRCRCERTGLVEKIDRIPIDLSLLCRIFGRTYTT